MDFTIPFQFGKIIRIMDISQKRIYSVVRTTQMTVLTRIILLLVLLLVSTALYSQQDNKNGYTQYMRVFTLSKDSMRTDIPENINFYDKMTGFLVIKVKYFFQGRQAKTKVRKGDKVYVELLQDSILHPAYLRLAVLKEKKDERVMSIWTASPLGANSRPKDVVDINLEKIDDRLFMINTKELETGHYAIYYQEELKTLMEFYDFDLVE